MPRVSKPRHFRFHPAPPLHVITRVRSFEGDAAIFERVYVPFELVPDLSDEPGVEMTNE